MDGVLPSGKKKVSGMFMKFPVVVYPSEESDVGAFTAHCLNMDLIADDNTVEGAVDKLLNTIEVALEASDKHRANVFRDAPREYWSKLADAKELPKELLERIIFNANKRHRNTKPLIDVEAQVELRQLEVAH